MKSVVFYFCVLFILSSCVSEKDLLLKVDKTQMNVNTDTTTFSNVNRFEKNRINLAEILLGYQKIRFYEDEHPELDSLSTTISYDGDKHLNVSIQNDTNVSGQFRIKVKNRGNYLLLKRKLFLIPIPFAFFIERDRRAILYYDSDRNLKIIHGENQFIWVFFGGGNEYVQESKFTIEPTIP